jgi:hypothetical protein
MTWLCWKLPLFLIVANDNQVNYSVILFIMWFSILMSVKELQTKVGSLWYQCVCAARLYVSCTILVSVFPSYWFGMLEWKVFCSCDWVALLHLRPLVCIVVVLLLVRVFKPCKWSACPMLLLVWWGCWKLCVDHISENFYFSAREVLSIFPTHLHGFPLVENVVYWSSNWWPKFVWVWNLFTSIHSSALIPDLLLWYLDIIAVEISLQFPRFVPVTLYIQVPSHQ